MPEMEGIMRELVQSFFDAPPADTPLDRAYEILEGIDEESSPKRQAALARKALEVCPDCADAYLVLAENAESRREALTFYEEAVAAGERSLGPEIFRDGVGDFWLMIETRPYMRARESLAHALWNAGRRAEAAEHLRELLRLNPNDNQGVRYILASWLASLDRDAELGELLARYDESSAMWAYSKALHAFRAEGDTAASRKRLKEAKSQNKHVPAYLTGESPLPGDYPASYSLGSEEEAVCYATAALSAWRDTPGAITWVRETLKGRRKAPSKTIREEPGGPTDADLKRLGRLAQKPDEWMVGFGPLPTWIKQDDDTRVQPWALLVASRTTELILGVQVGTGEPSSGQLWELLSASMRKPAAGKAHRPTLIEVQPDDCWDVLEPHLEALGIDLVRSESIEQLDFLMGDLSEQLKTEMPPALLDVPGVTPEIVEGFFAAAAEYYRKAPWKSVGLEDIVEVACAQFDSGPWYAVVMGEAGITVGLALYEDLKLLRKVLSGKLSDEENTRETVALTMTFESPREAHPGDLEAAREHGWEIAGPEAFPVIYRKERGLSIRPALAWELELMAASLRAIPASLAAGRAGAKGPSQFHVPAGTRTLDLTLRWID